jgi:hypothetical protein
MAAAALEGKAASGFAKLQTEEEEYLFVNLPNERESSDWNFFLQDPFNLSVQELIALKNARCPRGKNNSLLTHNITNYASFLISYFDSCLFTTLFFIDL